MKMSKAESIRVREYTSLMISARRASRQADLGEFILVKRQVLVTLLDTLDELTSFDTSEPNKIKVRRPK